MPGQDTLMKALTRSLSDGALNALGITGVTLAEPMPTDLPANTLRIDKAWRMLDGRVFHLEFQSTREPTLHRFLEYDARLARHHLTQVRTVVLYHAATPSAPHTLDIGTAVYHVENVFLSAMEGETALNAVATHLHAGQWEPEDRLRLALALTMHNPDVSASLERVLTLVAAVPDATERDLVVSALASLGDHGLTAEQRTRLRRELRTMSKMVEELFQEGRTEGERPQAIGLARKMLLTGGSVNKVMKFTDLCQADVQKLQEEEP
jgi:hypothetical protein